MLWKRVLAGAFTLIDILPHHVRPCAYELANNLTMFYHSGFFGHLELPAIFNIINMVSKLELMRKVTCRIEQYVDDFMAVSLSANVSSGWGINLDSMNVTVSRKNLLNCIHDF